MTSFIKDHSKLLAIILLAFLLRIIGINSYPIGLYSDEAVFGYNAKLLIETGRDEYNRFWPMSLESFGDWKPPMQAWLAIPFVWALGLNEYAVRLPSAILGTATIVVVYFLAGTLLRSDLAAARSDLFRNIPLAAALLLAINPWHIFMSRIAMLVAVEVFFISLGVLSLIKGLKHTVIPAKAGIYTNNYLYRFRVKPGMTRINQWWIVAAVSFSGAIYSYYGSRVTVPLILLIFTLVYFKELKLRLKELLIPVLVGAMLLSPLVIQSLKEPSILTGRARTTSVFFNDNVRLQLWDAHTKAGLKHIPPLVSRFFDNKLYYYARDIAGRYVSHFSPLFLFFRGDSHPPFKIPGLGYLHLVDLPFFIFGVILLRRRLKQSPGKKNMLFLLLYLIISPFVAGLTFLTPAANRSFNLVIPWTIITAYGLLAVLTMKQFNNLTMKAAIVFLYLISLTTYAYSYTQLVSQQLPHHWHYGRKELVGKLAPLLQKYDKIYLTNKGGPPYIFLSFYLSISPGEFHRTVQRNPVINDLGWGHVDRILGVTIPREFQWREVPKELDALYVGFEDEIPESEVEVLDRVYYPSGRPVYTLVKLKR